MKTLEYWVCTCHVTAETPQARQWDGDTDEAVVDVIMQTYSAEEIQRQIQEELPKMHLQLYRLEKTELILERFRREGMGLLDVITQVAENSPLRFAAFQPVLPEDPILPSLAGKINDIAPSAMSFSETDWNALFNNKKALWAVIDGVNCPKVSDFLSRSEAQSVCVYTATDPNTLATAPWLVRLEKDSDVTIWLKTLAHDQHWGILLHSDATLKQLRAHLRTYTMLWVPDNDHAPVYFRFYDPRVALDMAQALEPWKLGRLFAPFETICVPLSPLMALPEQIKNFNTPVSFADKKTDLHGRLIEIRLDDEQRDEHNAGKRFSISGQEYQRFGKLHTLRAEFNRAREFLPRYSDRKPGEILNAVRSACMLGKEYDMPSVKQTIVLTQCILELSTDFMEKYPAAKKIIADTLLEPWQRCNLLLNWLPDGCKQRDQAKQG